MSDSASLDTYAPSYFAAPSAASYYGPRIDYSTSGERLGFLMEETRTNIAKYSNDFTQADWAATNVTAAKTATGPDNTVNSASVLTATANNGTILQTITSASNARVTSCYVKRVSGTGAIDLTQDNGTTWTTVAITSSWTRVSLSSVTSTNPVVGLRIRVLGDVIQVYGFQHEVGSFVTSLIPTTTTDSRSADIAYLSNSVFPFSATAGTLFVNFNYTLAASDVLPGNRYALSFLNLTDALGTRLSIYNRSGQKSSSFVQINSVTQTTIAIAGTQPANTPLKSSLAYAANDFAFTQDGVTPDTSSSGSLPSVNTLYIGSASSTTPASINGHIRQIMYLPRRVTNEELQRETA
jgi:hypothetical protein